MKLRCSGLKLLLVVAKVIVEKGSALIEELMMLVKVIDDVGSKEIC